MGYNVTVSHTFNGVKYVSYYAHMSSLSVGYGQEISSGQQIGNTGNTGYYSDGEHLHIELLKGVETFDFGSRKAYAVNVLSYTGDPYIHTLDSY